MTRWTRSAFTLIELLVVMAIITILIGLLLPAVQKVRASAARTKCSNNLKQLALASHAYHDSQKLFPPASLSPSTASFLVAVLPFIEQNAVYQLFNPAALAANSIENFEFRTIQIPTYLCPSDPSAGEYVDVISSIPPGMTPRAVGRTNYYGNAGTMGIWIENSSTFPKPADRTGVFGLGARVPISAITDGTSNTAMYSEIKRSNRPTVDHLAVTRLTSWGTITPAQNQPANPNNTTPPAACEMPVSTVNETGLRYVYGVSIHTAYTHTVPPNTTRRDCTDQLALQFHLAARSYHTGGVNVALCDGSIRFVRDELSFASWQALGTRAGGETLQLD